MTKKRKEEKKRRKKRKRKSKIVYRAFQKIFKGKYIKKLKICRNRSHLISNFSNRTVCYSNNGVHNYVLKNIKL